MGGCFPVAAFSQQDSACFEDLVAGFVLPGSVVLWVLPARLFVEWVVAHLAAALTAAVAMNDSVGWIVVARLSGHFLFVFPPAGYSAAVLDLDLPVHYRAFSDWFFRGF